jgi:tRNA A37 methylthiotransferase MiaB
LKIALWPSRSSIEAIPFSFLDNNRFERIEPQTNRHTKIPSAIRKGREKLFNEHKHENTNSDTKRWGETIQRLLFEGNETGESKSVVEKLCRKKFVKVKIYFLIPIEDNAR